jgi:hypothetical protein
LENNLSLACSAAEDVAFMPRREKFYGDEDAVLNVKLE